MIHALLVLVMALFWVTDAHAAFTYYVTTSGSNANSCEQAKTQATAKRFFNPDGNGGGGLGCLASGDTLLVGDGTYNEVIGRNTIPSGSGTTESMTDPWPNATTIKAINARQVILKPLTVSACTDGLLGVIRTGGRNWLVFDGLVLDANNVCIGAYRMDDSGCSGTCVSHHHRFINGEIRNGAGSSGGVGMISAGNVASAQNCNLQQLHLKNNLIHDQDADGTFPTSGNHLVYDIPCNSLFENNDFYRAAASGVTNHNGTNGSTIRNNRFWDIGIGLDGSTECGAAIRLGKQNNVAYNNVIWNSSNCTGSKATITAPIQVHHNTPSNTQILYNTIYNSRNTDRCLGVTSVAVDTIVRGNICAGGLNDKMIDNGTGTLFSANRCSTTTGTMCTTTLSPGFVDANNNDFHLASGSAMIGLGTTVALVATDFDGISRPQQGTYDIGAFEFVPAAVPPPDVPFPPVDAQVSAGARPTADERPAAHARPLIP